jgi:hypothetical protein
MKRIYVFSILLLALTWACGNEEANDQKTDQVQDEVEEVDSGWKGLAILDGGYKFGIEIPNESVIDKESKTQYLEDRGEIEIKIGEGFDIFVLEDESQMEMVKNELNDHAFYEVEYVLQNDSCLLYRLYTVDGEKEQWQMYAERKIGETTLLVRSNEMSFFTEYEAKLMLESALRITPF